MTVTETRATEPPAGMPEMDGMRENWVAYLGRQFRQEIGYIRQRYAVVPEGDPYPGAVQFTDPTVGPLPATAQLQTVAWSAFPRSLLLQEESGDVVALTTAEIRQSTRTMLYTGAGEPVEIRYRAQDEYCEWHVDRGPDGGMRRITFSCEPADYWSAVGQGHPAPFFMLPGAEPFEPVPGAGRMDRVLARYREVVSPEVPLADLVFVEDLFSSDDPATRELMFRRGDYNPFNAWNVEHGIVHLSHPANTLGEEIELVGDATVLRRDTRDRLIQAAKCLLCCGGFGDINRHSDPAIGAAVNELARTGYTITLANPVGLYISHLEDAGWTRPDGSPLPPGYWRIERMAAGVAGQPGSARGVRAVYEVPEGETYDDGLGGRRPMRIEDIHVDGRPVRHPGQIAAAVQMVLTLAAWPLGWPATGGAGPPPVHCEPFYRCCRSTDGGQLLHFVYAEDALRRAGRCGDRQVDAFDVVRLSADRRHSDLAAARQEQPGPPAATRSRRGRRGGPGIERPGIERPGIERPGV